MNAFAPNTRTVCPVCSKSAMTTKTGAIRQHGHTNRRGCYGVATICPATGCTNDRDALAAAVKQAETTLANARKADAERSTVRTRMDVESAERNLATARKAAETVMPAQRPALVVSANAPAHLREQIEREIVEGRIRVLVPA